MRLAHALLCFGVPFAVANDAGDGFSDLKPPAPVADGRVARLDAVDEIACAACHRDIADEWSRSAHALAWVDELYQEEVADKKKPEGCWGCHVPTPLADADLSQKPAPRENARHLGIECATCHLAAEGKILGPFGAATDAHVSVKDARFAGAGSDALCATCHRTNVGPVLGVAKDFEATEQSKKGRSCVGCHMAPLERPIANAKPGAEPHEFAPRAGRSHALQTPRDPSFLARSFELSAHAGAGRTEVSFVNVTGHRVPGLIGRELAFTAEVLDASGAVVGKGTLKLDFRSFAPVDATQTLAVAAVGAKVRIVGMHTDPRLERPVEFLRRELAVQAGK